MDAPDRPASDPAAPPRSPSVPPALAPGLQVAGRYELVRCLGTGSMGEVWAARHRSLGEEVAIKLVLRDATNEDGSPVMDGEWVCIPLHKFKEILP